MASQTQRRAVVSVFNKNGVVEFCSQLYELGFEIVSTGGTFKQLSEAGIKVTQVSDVTQFPEILGGRVKTLHPTIHGGILARRNEAHLAELSKHNIAPISVVVCNLYPFTETLSKPNVSEAEIIEEIDIGGVTLLRAAAKNFESVAAVCDPADYPSVIEGLKQDAGLSPEQRKKLALKAFRHTASYDAAISSWFATNVEGADALPQSINLSAEVVQTLRYGENPHQQGALYKWTGKSYPFEQLQGKELSYNNILDVDAAWAVVEEFADPACCIIKHNTPCGIATAANIVDAYQAAFESDTVSAFGGIIAVNRDVDVPLLEAIGKLFVEVLVARSFTNDALEWLSNKKKNCRVMRVKHDIPKDLVIRSVFGGILVQTPDNTGVKFSDWKVVTKKQPTEEQMKELAFAWIAVKHVKSNAITLVRGTATVGIGCGQPNRLDSVRTAGIHAGEKAKGSVLGSDAFFPFPDGVEAAAAVGAVAIVQPGGSVRDNEVIEVADKLGLVMIFTGERHFKH